jgi:hypothetical protein
MQPFGGAPAADRLPALPPTWHPLLRRLAHLLGRPREEHSFVGIGRADKRELLGVRFVFVVLDPSSVAAGQHTSRACSPATAKSV